MLGFINKNKILAFFAAMAATQTLLYYKEGLIMLINYNQSITKKNERK